MQSPIMSETERESQALRASVIEAAFSLGPKVAKLIFEEPIAEESLDENLSDQILTPGLTSSASSEDSHYSGLTSPDGYPGQGFSKFGKRSHPKISLPLQLGAASKTTLEQSYLESPFVVVNGFTPSLPSPAPLENPHTPPRKKPSKSFLFTPRKRNKTPINQSEDQIKRPDIPTPIRSTTISSEDTSSSSPSSTASPASPPRPFSPSTSSISNSANSRLTPSKLRKQSHKEDWDFKDTDRPSFFIDQGYVAKNGSEGDFDRLDRSSSMGRGSRSKSASRKPSFGEDSGYLSEGSGLRFRGEKDRSGKPPLKRSLSSRFMRKLSGGTDEPIPPLPKAPVSLPIASRYASQRDDERLLSPNDVNTTRAGNSPHGHGSRDTIYSSVSSFALMPDLNAAKRLGLDKYIKLEQGVVGSDNDLKMEMLAKLLAERPIPRLEAEDINQMLNKRNTLYVPPAPPIRTNLGRDRSQYPLMPQSARPDLETHYRNLRGRPEISFMDRAQMAQSLVRGREAPFPVKSILRKIPQVRAITPALSCTPDRYQGLDVPRSVKSSYSKELEREEGGEERDEDDDSQSVYSGYTKYVDEETDSRASFMDISKSNKAREMLVGGVFGDQTHNVY